jgi:putative copper export protein
MDSDIPRISSNLRHLQIMVDARDTVGARVIISSFSSVFEGTYDQSLLVVLLVCACILDFVYIARLKNAISFVHYINAFSEFKNSATQ